MAILPPSEKFFRPFDRLTGIWLLRSGVGQRVAMMGWGGGDWMVAGYEFIRRVRIYYWSHVWDNPYLGFDLRNCSET